MLINGVIEPAIRLGDFWIGAEKEEVIAKTVDPYTVYDNEYGCISYHFDNYGLWFDENGRLRQIGVTKGFWGNYKSVHIGTTMKEIADQFGGYIEDEDEYEIPGVKGLCFELGDTDDEDDWDELAAPIEWIFVYR